MGNDIDFTAFGYPDCFIEHGDVDEIERQYELDTSSIARKILEKA